MSDVTLILLKTDKAGSEAPEKLLPVLCEQLCRPASRRHVALLPPLGRLAILASQRFGDAPRF